MFWTSRACTLIESYVTQEPVMAEEHKHEEKPWSPRIDSEPLLNPFANPQDGQPAHPVALEGVEEEESDAEEESRPAE